MVDRRYSNGGGSQGRGSSAPRHAAPPSASPGRGGGSRGPPRDRDVPAGRVYVGNLPSHADKKLVEELFGKFGRVVEISIKRTISGSPFAFVEYEDPRDAQDAIQDRDGYKIDGCALRVEIPFSARGAPRGGGGGGHYGGMRGGGGGGGRSSNQQGPPRRAEFRVSIKGLPPSGSWQDLKDHMREAGDCAYADVYHDGTGVVEFARREDMDYALRHFGDSKFRSHEGETSHITVTRLEDDQDRSPRGGGHERSPRYNRRSPPGWSDNHRGGGRDNRGGGGGGGRLYERRPPSCDTNGPPPSYSSDAPRRGRSRSRRSATPPGGSRSRSRSFRRR